MKAKTLTIKLSQDRFDHEPLGLLLEKAISITFPAVAEYGEHYQRKEANRLVRLAVRAVSEEVIRTGSLTLPLAVRFTKRTGSPQPSNVIQFESRPA